LDFWQRASPGLRFAPEEERRGHPGCRVSWLRRKNGPRQKDKWAMGKKREKEENKEKMKENKYERKVKGGN
jgi:hypothetical protein